MNSLKKIPKFKNEKQEREFWQNNDSSKYIDYSKAVKAKFPNLQLTSKPITIRLNVELIDRIKIKANKLDMPYQTYIKQIIYNNL